MSHPPYARCEFVPTHVVDTTTGETIALRVPSHWSLPASLVPLCKPTLFERAAEAAAGGEF